MDELSNYERGSASTIGMAPNYYNSHQSGKLGKSRQWLVNLLIIGIPILLCAILVIILMFVPDMKAPEPPNTQCLPSAESDSSKLTATLKKIQTEFYNRLYPEKIYSKPGVTPEEIRSVYRPWDPSPNTIKFKTDEAAKLLKELKDLKINTTLLKIRERKAVHVAKAILLNNFGWAPYGQNYYGGDWMFGPDFFCWQPICTVLLDFGAVIETFKPHNTSELKKLDQLFNQVNHTFERYIANLELGVLTGYVRPKKACVGGLHNFHYVAYRNIALENETGVYKEAFSNVILKEDFFEELSKDDKEDWKDKHGEEVMSYFNQSLITKIGRPALKMLRYVEGEHLQQCAPETVASGLQKLPLSYGYKDELADTSIVTTKELPTGEQLEGKNTYKSLMRFFTTFDITPEVLREKAQKRLDELLPQAVQLAKDYTGFKNNVSAIDEFSIEFQAQDKYFNDKSFPANESGDEAFIKCNDIKSAEAYCPKRYKAMKAWIDNTEKNVELIDTYFGKLFHESGPKNCVPDCPAEIVPWFHPHAVFHAYFIGSKDCSIKAKQGLPFFTENYGPKWTEYTTVVHEIAGHHIEVQSFTEYFQGDCTDPIAWLNAPNYFTAITEGWASYAEYQLYPMDTELYTTDKSDDKENREKLRQKYGMLYYQILHALRAAVDIDLHYYGKDVSLILEMYRKYVWEDNNHQVKKDIYRIQSTPAFVTSYMIGQLEIERVREMAEKELGDDFSLKDFHYEILREGEFPLDYLEEHIKAYIACKKNPSSIGCEEIV